MKEKRRERAQSRFYSPQRGVAADAGRACPFLTRFFLGESIKDGAVVGHVGVTRIE